MDDNTEAEYLRPVTLDPAVFAKAESVAQRLKATTIAPLVEIVSLRNAAIRGATWRAARALRFAATLSELHLKARAIEAAEALEAML
jgi:hypothetical protein